MTTPKERMSDERLAQLREMYFNNQGVKNLFAECISEIDALRTELTATRERENETAGRVEAAILSLSAAKAEAERNWAEQEERGTIAQTDLNIALNKLATAERERDEFKSAYRQAADEVIEQSKRADRCYEAGIETGVAIGEQNKRDGLAEDRGGSLKEVFDTLKARASAAERERDEARAALAAIARNADDATDLSLFRVQCRDFAKSALKTTPTERNTMMIVQSLKDLERRLAEAKGPDREIDCFLWAIGREQLAWQGDLLVSPSEGVIGYIDPGKHSRNFSTSRATAGPGSLPASTASLDAAIALVERVLPGWFWTTGKCKLNAHATVGPDRDGPHAHLLKDPTFDNGFDADMEHGIPALALCLACVRALIAQGEK